MKKIIVDLGKRSYPIYIGAGIIDNSVLLQRHVRGRQIFLVSNETVSRMYLDRITPHYVDFILRTIVLPDGEEYKSLTYLEQIITTLLENKFNRDCCLIAVGGGVVGDITGFAAACYQRGVAFIQVPTTLLAQVDSSVGGKTAVNHSLGKNMIGAFHQPEAVFSDITVLASLPDRELSAGMAEMIKYGLIRDAHFFDWLDEHIELLLGRDQDALIYAIEQSCLNKAAVVAADERESGLRAILNFGHTFGHAIETVLEYKVWLHGESVACGMLMAAELSRASGWLATVDVERIRQILKRTGLPARLPAGVTARSIFERMKVDKKVKEGEVMLVLLTEIGKAVVTADYGRPELKKTIDQFVFNNG